MTYENVNLGSPNMTGDRDNGYFYSFHRESGVISLYQYNKNTPGDPINNTYPLTEDITNDVVCTQFDGYFYWTMERQTNGVTLKKWELVSNILYRRAIFSFADSAFMRVDAYSFCVEYYGDELAVQALPGSSSLTVDDPDIFNIGDTIILGPSTNATYINEYETAYVVGKSGGDLVLSTPISKGFEVNNKVYTARYFYLFNKYSPHDTSKGSLLKYDVNTGVLQSYSSSHMFAEVKASCFFDDKIMFVKGNDVVFVTPTTLALYKYMGIDNLDVYRSGNVDIYALWGFSNTLYTIRDRYVYYDSGESEWSEEAWADAYNYVSVSLLPIVFFIEIRAEPSIIHAVSPPGVPTTTSNIVVTVLDQYRVPINGRTVNLSSNYGSLTPSTGTTDTNGQLYSVYNGTADLVDVEIKATVP